jgi:predicted dehydrogenase
MATQRIGVIGCGTLARSAHIPILSKMKGVRVVALADRNPDALALAAKLVPDAMSFTDEGKIIAGHAVDAVVIAAPPSAQPAIAYAAFEARISVYLEKPIAANLDDAARIVDAWKRSGVTGVAGFNYRFNPLYSKLHAAVDKAQIKKIESVFRTPRPESSSWRAARSAGGGALFDLASHEIDLVRFMSRDEIAMVTATLQSRGSEHDLAQLELTTSRGITASITAEYGDSFQHSMTIATDTEVLSIDLATSHDVERNSAKSTFPSPSRLAHIYAKLRSPLNEPSYKPALRNFVDAVSSHWQTHPNIYDGYASLMVVDAAERSSSSGAAVTLPIR